MEQNKAKELSRADLLAITTIPVGLTYNFTTPPIAILFQCKMALSADDVAARQAFYSKPDGDIAAGQYAYQVDMLGRIVTGVKGLPGFEYPGGPRAANAGPAPTLAEALAEYFATDEPILKKIAGDFMDQYSRITQPAEFFR